MSKVESHYDSSPEREWDRLGKKNPIEFAITMLALSEYLPKAPACILDIGGGPGRYAIALTQQGYSVTLLDLSQGNLDYARTRADEADVQLADYIHGNALDLSLFADESFDAVLLLGPMYHLLDMEEREQAVKEALRTLKTGGCLFIAFLLRSSFIRFLAKDFPALILNDHERDAINTGILKPEPGEGFTDAYLAHHHEIKPFMERWNLQMLDLISCEGLITMIDDKLNELTGEAWESWVTLNYAWAKDPAIHGMAEHLLYVGRKL